MFYVLECVCILNKPDICQQMTVIGNLLVPAELWKIYTHRFLIALTWIICGCPQSSDGRVRNDSPHISKLHSPLFCVPSHLPQKMPQILHLSLAKHGTSLYQRPWVVGESSTYHIYIMQAIF